MEILGKEGEIIFSIHQEEYDYWMYFTEEHIRVCDSILHKHPSDSKTAIEIRKVKDIFEKILFVIDVFRDEPQCIVTIPSTYSSLFYSLMKKQQSTIKQKIESYKVNWKEAINGENKRNYYDKFIYFQHLHQIGQSIIKAIETFRKSVEQV